MKEPHGQPSLRSMCWGPRKLVSDSCLRNVKDKKCSGSADGWGDVEVTVWEARMHKKRSIHVSCGPNMSPPMKRPLGVRSSLRGPPGGAKSHRYCWFAVALSKIQWTRGNHHPKSGTTSGRCPPCEHLEENLWGTHANAYKRQNQPYTSASTREQAGNSCQYHLILIVPSPVSPLSPWNTNPAGVRNHG